ncbi:YbjN domain-containing protein [Shimwellia pseudoproteus]|uniref:YbjN domain-containing protein n=1 Tax=Shimwellia pseudoproteus TaxID=570012 RepID=UPI0018EC4901|nr:YbjN domain-containing protein [Shimwellia pseudoproteus]MBJ3816351.1 YbjN domain-containing protein [Shimwellia pseudoproteus]
MESLVIPTLEIVRRWMDEIGVTFYECDSCQALHLPHMQNFEGVFDAKIDLIDNVLLFSALAEVKPSALLALSVDLSSINASSLTMKAFLDVQDDNLPKLVVCQALSVTVGVTREQFAAFMKQSEEQVSMVILEASANQLLYSADDEAVAEEPEVTHFLH